MATIPSESESRWPHRAAVLLVCATFPLIWLGGLVTTYDAGMAVPDWPSTYGYNLLLYPWSTWIGGPWDLFVEHGHRLLGMLVGLLTIALVAATYRFERRRWVRGMAWGALVLVLLQGGLGGARVLMDARSVALIHGCVGPAFFAYAVVMAAITSRYWSSQPTSSSYGYSSSLTRVAVATSLLSYGQLVLGANLRHVSPWASPGLFRAVLWFHLLVAVLLVGHGLYLAACSCRRGTPALVRRPAWILCFLIGLQLTLGAATWILKYGWPQWLQDQGLGVGWLIEAESLRQAMTVTMHVATGSLILATSVLVSVRVVRSSSFTANSAVERVMSKVWKLEGSA